MIKARVLVITIAALASAMMLAIGTILALNEARVLPLGQQQQVQALPPASAPPAATPASGDLLKNSKPAAPASDEPSEVDYQR